MRKLKNIMSPCVIALFAITAATGTALAQWGEALLDSVSVGPADDHLERSSLALDDLGTLHLLYDRWVGGGDHDFYYTQKPLGGSWSAAVPVGDPAANLSSPYLTVHKSSGVAYLVFLQDGSLKLGTAAECNWVYYDLPISGVDNLLSPAVTVDADGNAHITVIAETGGVYKIGYGYWDASGTTPFDFQIIQASELGPYGGGAAPDICVTADGGVAIAYRAGTYLDYRIDVAENFVLGGTDWNIQTIYQPGYQCYAPSIKSTANDNLYLAYFGDMGWGFPGRIFFTYKPGGAYSWGPSTLVSGDYSGVAPKLAVMDFGIVHIVFEERSGNILTGNICYSSNLSGSWEAQYLLQGEKYSPSLAVDWAGNGSLAFQQYEYPGNDYDVYYYGYVASGPPLPEVSITLTPENPPIEIPAEGGSFSFTGEVHNNLNIMALIDIWTDVVLPDGSIVGPILLIQDFGLGPGFTRSKTFTQFVPGGAPAGTYTYRGFTGDYPSSYISDSDSFTFSKLGSDNAGFSLDDWCCSETGAGTATPQASTLLNSSPNPFNSETVLHYAIPRRARVELKIFDLMGRRVTTLLDRMQEAGEYQVVWSASNLTAGVYVVRLNVAGEEPQVMKLVLLK